MQNNYPGFENLMPLALPGFEVINRYWDPKNNTFAAKIFQGEYYVTHHNEIITTVLGSCVAACIRDTKLCLGGMNHFMLPTDESASNDWKNSPVNIAARYGNVAMERLINSIIAHGGNRKNFEIKLFGGGNVLDIKMDIGKLNIDFIRSYMKNERLNIAAEDVGGDYPRKLVYYPASGRARVRNLKLHNDTLFKREERYIEYLQKQVGKTDIELF